MADEKAPKTPRAECVYCGRPGGTLQINPYREEINNVRVTERLHAEFADELRMEI